ncbi:MAG: hypothetical protein HFF18_14470 [Oscillospiraceae bacterium]|nr:hypothetical protein [Oscillospiraceae bacterium]
MSDMRKLYRETFSTLRASEHRIEEVISMTEQKKVHKKSRAALIALAACAALCVSASAANLATDGEFFEVISNMIQVNRFKQEGQLEDGTKATIYMADADLENRDGRAILIVAGEETDITDELSENGVYHYLKKDGGTICEVNVTGTPETWSMDVATYDEGEESPMFFTKTSEDEPSQSSVTIAGGEHADAGFRSSSTWAVSEEGVYVVDQ